MSISIIDPSNIKDISGDLLMENGKMKLLSYKDYEKYPFEDFRYFCHNYGRYGIPTIELVEFVNRIINGRSAIEIGAGAGDLGYHLGIKMTDSKIQEEPIVKDSYKMMGQPTIQYPEDVEKIDALSAVQKYKPEVVVSSWTTPYSETQESFGSSPYGIREPEILNLVNTYIFIGNFDIHWDKPIRKLEHAQIQDKMIVSRSHNPEKNIVFIWNKL